MATENTVNQNRFWGETIAFLALFLDTVRLNAKNALDLFLLQLILI
jgi:hypothetical protein